MTFKSDSETALEFNKKVLRAANNAMQVILAEFASETPRNRFLLVSRAVTRLFQYHFGAVIKSAEHAIRGDS